MLVFENFWGNRHVQKALENMIERERIPQTRICFLNKCGHNPWLEQPEAFYRELGEFLHDRT